MTVGEKKQAVEETRERKGAAERKPVTRLQDVDAIRAAGRGFDPAIAASALALNLLGLALPLAVLQIYDKMASTQALETLSFLGVGLVIVALLEFALRVAQSYSLSIDAQRLGYRVTIDAVERQLSQLKPGDRRDSAAVTMEKFRALDTITGYASGDQRRDLIDLPFAAIFIGAIFFIGGPLVFAPVAVIAAAVLVSWAILLKSRDLADKRDTAARRRADFLGEFFAGQLTVKGLGAEQLILRRFERLTGGSAKTYRDSFNAATNLQLAMSAFGGAATISVVGVGAIFVVDGSLTPGGLAACSMLASRAVQPLVRSVGAVAERHKALLAAESARTLFDGPPATPAVFGVAQARRNRAPAHAAHVSAKGVVLEDHERVVLDEAHFELKRGGVSLLEASNGEDCKAFFRMLAGLQEPKQGELLIDGGAPLDMRDRPGRIVVSTPTTRLFRGAIMENLTLFGAAADTEDALCAAQKLGIDAVVGRLPAGYDTMVAMGAGESLSQSHLRMIIIARALAQRPSLLLLDHPELYLDQAAEERLYQALHEIRAETTVVLRSERPGAAAIADSRLTVREGWFSQTAQSAEPQAGAMEAAS